MKLSITLTMSVIKKRKIDNEGRQFNKQWTTKYFFTDVGGRAVCLICQDVVSVFKEYNVKRHFQTKHVNFGSKMSETELERKANDMLKSLKQQQTIFVKAVKHTGGSHKS